MSHVSNYAISKPGAPSVARSCITCHQRKVKCDRATPCSNCARGGLLCRYPSADRPQPRNASPSSDITRRLQRVETLLLKLLNGNSTESLPAHVKDHAESQDVPAEPTQSLRSDQRTWETLVKDGHRVHYVDNTNLLDLFQNEEEISAPETHDTQDNALNSPGDLVVSLGLWPVNSGGVVGSATAHPDAQFALKLWKIYVENVDPVLKILHIPTMQSTMITIISDSEKASMPLQALAFAVYFAAVTSACDSELPTMSSTDTRQTLLQRFKAGLNQVLLKSNLLNEPNFIVLQALAIFVTCLRVHENSRAVWILIGTAIRLAQSLGIHRHGRSLGLGPFESEIRLRLWWHLCLLDSRATEDHGFALTVETLDQGLRLPLSLDDTQLIPGMTSTPPDSNNWTEETFSLVQIESARLILQVLGQRFRDDSNILEEIKAKRKLVQEHNEWAEKRYFSTPLATDAYRVTRAHYDTACAKIEFMLQVREEAYLGPDKDSRSRVLKGLGEKPFEAACKTLETSWSLLSGQLSTRFVWLFKTYTQWYALAYTLRYLHAFPSDPNSEKAWMLVNRIFNAISYGQGRSAKRPGQHDTSGRSNIWRCLEFLRSQALKAKSKADGLLSNETPTEIKNSSQKEFNTVNSMQDLPRDNSLSSDAQQNGGFEGSTAEGSYLFGNTWGQWAPSPGDLNGFTGLSETAMLEMLYLPEWSDIINSNSDNV